MITNLQNPRIKNIIKLQQKSSERKRKEKFIIEGKRELSIAQQSRFDTLEIYLCEDIYKYDTCYPIEMSKQNTIPASIDVYNKIAYRKNSEGVIAVAKMKNRGLSNLILSPVPLIMVIESVEKPGNLGAILRTADAAKVDAVIICDPKTDLYNPNVIRSSLGCVFSNQVIACSTEEVIEWFNKNSINIYIATPESDKYYYELNYTKPSAIIFGSESEGLSKKWNFLSKNKITIPMKGKIDSLNVSVSTAIVIFEAIRQRNQLSVK